MNEKQPLPNRALHISGTFMEPEKANIDAEKANIEDAFTVKTASHVQKLKEALGTQNAFGRSDVQKMHTFKIATLSTRRYSMLPTLEESKKELEIASRLNPGPWIGHSLNVGIAARNIAQNIPDLDENKAQVLGMLHDIGRRVGIVSIPKHVYEGYVYSMEKGWDEVARICMTHSYPLMQDEFDYLPDTEEERFIKEYISNCQADDYDKLIQICDALATDYGFVILEKRFVDVTRRYGIMETYVKGWDVTFHNKEYFEKKMGRSIYDVLPDIGRTTLLCPPPWKPGQNVSS